MDRSIYDATSHPDMSGASRAMTGLEHEAGAHDAASLQQALSEVTHDINNPLAIISGNAQLLLELARMLDLDADVAKPIRDIEEASHRLASTISRLNALKETLLDEPTGDGV